jgi:hypothetical protein
LTVAEEVARAGTDLKPIEPIGPTSQLQHLRTSSMTLEEAIELYKSVGKRNADYLFHWLHNIYSRITLPMVSPEYKSILALDKAKMAMFDVIADDLADNSASRDPVALDRFLQIPWQKDIAGGLHVEVGKKLWEDCIKSVRDYPRFKEFENVFYFDLRQVVSGMEYSYLANTIEMANPIDNRIHVPHGCMVMLHCDLDLMCSPRFDIADLGTMRMIFHMAQRVAHIGNLLNTYPREVLEKDLSCPLISLALRKGLITKEDLNDELILPKISVLESTFREEAEKYIRRAARYEKQVRSVNMIGFSAALKALLDTFVARPQYWKLRSQV